MSGTVTFPMNRAIGAKKLAQADEPALAGRASFFFLCLFTVAIYARPEDVFPAIGQIHLTLLLGACACIGYVAAWFSGNMQFLNSRELKLMLLLTAWFAAGVPFAYWRGGSADVLTQTWLKTLLVFFLLTQTLLSLRRIRTILWAIILSELAVTAYSVLNPDQSAWVGDRMSGVSKGMLGWNFLGIAIALTVPFIAALFVERASIIRSLLLAAATAAMMWMLVLTASRSGIIIVAFSIVLTWIFVLRGTSRGKLVGIGLIVAMVVAVAAAPGVFWQRIQTIWTSSDPATRAAASADQSEDERRTVLLDSVRYTMENPVFGLGLGNFSVARGNALGVPSAWLGSHNSFTELSSEAGIPALILFVVLISCSIRSMWRLSHAAASSAENSDLNRMARATLVSLIAFVFGGFFAHIAYEYYLYYPIAIAVAVEHLSPAMTPATIEKKVRVKTLAVVKPFAPSSRP
jgi:O-antigen ligase